MRSVIRDPLRSRQAKSVPLGSSFWAAYWDADCSLVGSPPSTWNARQAGSVMLPGNAPTIGSVGGRTAVSCAKASTQYMRETTVGPLAGGDDTAFTVAWHGVHSAMASSDTVWAVSSTADAVHYYRCRIASTGLALTIAGRDGVVGSEAVGASVAALPAAGTPYSAVFVRHGDTYDFWVNGAASVLGGTLALATLGTLNTFSFGALFRSTGAGLPGNIAIRRIAFAVGDSITATQVAALHAAWIGK